MDTLKSISWNGLKLVASGALIAAIGMAFVVLTPEGSVDEADADIHWMGPGSLDDPKQQKFVEFLEREGFSEPQPYNYNGNIVYFSHGETTESPREVSMRLQKGLVRDGINENVYPVPPNPNALEKAEQDHKTTGDINREELAYSTMGAQEYLSGGMIPVLDTGDQIALNGVETGLRKKEADDLPNVIGAFYEFPGHDIADFFTNFRYLEAFRSKGAQKTQKIAVFGDGNVDFAKFRPGAGGLSSELRADQQIPACPGCERNSHLSGMESQRDYGMETYNSPDSIDGVLRFYERALLDRGWAPALGMQVVQNIRRQTAPYDAADQQGEMVAYVRDGQMVHIHVEEAERVGTHVNIFRGQ